MFSADIQIIEAQLGIEKYLNSNNQSSSGFDLQYELYSKYMKISSQQIAVKQHLIISQTSQLLSNFATINLYTQKDSSTLDSLTYDDDMDNSIMNDFSIIERSKKRITRKGTTGRNNSVLNKSVDMFNELLRQVQDQCSQSTYSCIKNLINQHKKANMRVMELQKKQMIYESRQKNIKRHQQKLQRLEQQNILLKQKLFEIENKVNQKQKEIQCFKSQNNIKSLKQSRISSTSGSDIFDSQKNLDNLKQTTFKQMAVFLQQKQAKTYLRMKKVSEIQTSFEDKLQKSIISKQNKQNESCERCCNMIKKIKDSVLNYRKYLEQQAEQLQAMYQKYKVSFLVLQNNNSI